MAGTELTGALRKLRSIDKLRKLFVYQHPDRVAQVGLANRRISPVQLKTDIWGPKAAARYLRAVNRRKEKGFKRESVCCDIVPDAAHSVLVEGAKQAWGTVFKQLDDSRFLDVFRANPF